jgi:hypothetical protein
MKANIFFQNVCNEPQDHNTKFCHCEYLKPDTNILHKT